MGLLLLKLRAAGLDCKLVYIVGKTVKDMVLDSYFRQIAKCSQLQINFESHSEAATGGVL